MHPRRRTPDLPAPDEHARGHSERMRQVLVAAIEAAGGRLPFDAYMNRALYEPGLGYYSAGAQRFGPGGDFTTAPLMTPLFSRTLALQVAEVLAGSDGDTVLEFGAGNGVMAADMLAELERLDSLPARYLIVEVSAALREEQSQTLAARVPALADRVQWLERLPQTPVNGVIVANEVMDALPVKRFQASANGVEELVVTDAGGRFGWDTAAPAPALLRALAEIEQARGAALPAGYVSEWCPGLGGWIAAVADCLGRGVALLVDYGFPRAEYYHAQRRMGTLLCHYRHRAHDDPFHLPGLQDITAFVDFTAVAEAALGAGLDVLGYTTQAHFLMGAGLPQLIEQAMAEDRNHGAELAQQAKPLLFPDELGERFKVLALGRGMEATLSGFGLFDHRDRLAGPA
jgi:SAM-dependent MidA family methyltransferase